MTVTFDQCPDVRLAQIEDFEGVMALMHEAADEDKQHPMDDLKVRNMVMKHFNKQGALLAFIGEVGNPVAYLFCILDEIWYAPPGTYQLLELSLFTHPDHRKTTYARQLMNFSKQAAEGLQLDLTIGVLSHARVEAKIRLYKRQFPHQVGVYFMYRPQSATA